MSGWIASQNVAHKRKYKDKNLKKNTNYFKCLRRYNNIFFGSIEFSKYFFFVHKKAHHKHTPSFFYKSRCYSLHTRNFTDDWIHAGSLFYTPILKTNFCRESLIFIYITWAHRKKIKCLQCLFVSNLKKKENQQTNSGLNLLIEYIIMRMMM